MTHGDVNVDGNFTFDENTTSVFQPKPDGGPDPLISSLVIHISDLPPRTVNFADFPALFDALADSLGEEGNYTLVGDANGNIPILAVEFTFDTPTSGADPATANVELIFHDPGPDGLLFTTDDLGAPLPDDRYTLTVSDNLADPAGNPLDGESGAAAPFEGNDVPNATPPIFPTGDGEHGGDFDARFTVDSRPEIGTWAAGSVWVDTNGNFTFDPWNTDYTNRDIIYTQGFTSDDVFAGNFFDANLGDADGFDKLAAYGRIDGTFRWLIDTNNDGDPDRVVDNTQFGNGVNGLPLAGEIAPGLAGDELVIFAGGDWFFYNLDGVSIGGVTNSAMTGLPFMGDFDGNGIDDLGTFADDVFQIRTNLGTGPLQTFRFGFIGVRERPVAADMNGDGIDDIGLWVPDRTGVTPAAGGEWYFLLSGGDRFTTGGGLPIPDGNPDTVLDRIVNADDPSNETRDPGQVVEFNPIPFGNDIYAQFGDEFALPIVGNFDPPVAASSESTSLYTNLTNPLDVSNDGYVTARDALMVIHHINTYGSGAAGQMPDEVGSYLDVSGDGFITPRDALEITAWLNSQPGVSSDGDAEGESDTRMAAVASVALVPLGNEVQAGEHDEATGLSADAGEGLSREVVRTMTRAAFESPMIVTDSRGLTSSNIVAEAADVVFETDMHRDELAEALVFLDKA